eukprot:4013106-Ditylum_brightwellii.AAC.1
MMTTKRTTVSIRKMSKLAIQVSPITTRKAYRQLDNNIQHNEVVDDNDDDDCGSEDNDGNKNDIFFLVGFKYDPFK